MTNSGHAGSAQAGQFPGEDITPREQLDLLVSRIADGEASEQDWRQFDTLAKAHPEAWKQLAQAQRQHGELSLAVGVALNGAERVELPVRSAGYGHLDHHGAFAHAPLHRLRSWGGWAVAAVVAMAWLGGHRLGVIAPASNPGANMTQVAGWTSDDYASAYLSKGQKEGRVFGELAARPLEIRTAANGQGFDVLYVRQIVEQARVKDLMKFGVDETGRPVPVRYSPPDELSAPQ